MTFTLYPFQEAAVEQMSTAIARWSDAARARGRVPSSVDGDPIPLLGHITAITGAGKTPILASIVGRLGPAIVIWTTNRAVVVEQTVEKLRTTYRHFLPPDTTIIGEMPTRAEWEAVVGDETGVVIWCRTVASWNDTDQGAKGTEAARLNIHRPAPDWAGDRSPWEQLGDLETRKRPLWVVYDEGHGQTETQLDQLLELHPVGILAASGTPAFSPKIDRLRAALEESEVFGPIAKQAMVTVSTTDVAKAGLLKSAIDVVDLNTDAESKIAAAVEHLRELDRLAAEAGVAIAPRALYVTEESNRAKGDPRPLVIWELLTQRCGVPAAEIAIATNTKEIPQEADRVVELSQLRPRHRHIIFNKKFQEGWDDPAAYVAYFDGETKSVTRVAQIIGRVIRQPDQQHVAGVPELNTASIFLSSPDERFKALVDSLRRHLLEEYGANEFGEANVRVTRRSERPAAIPLREGLPELSVPVLAIDARAMQEPFERIASAGKRPYAEEDLEAPGRATRMSFNMTDAEKRITSQVIEIGKHIRSSNRDYFLDQVRQQSAQAYRRLPDAIVMGPMFDQSSAVMSPAQADLARLATEFVEAFDARARYVVEPDPESDSWSPVPLAPTRPGTIVLERSVHAAYPDAPSFLNSVEKELAHGLAASGEGWWVRNPPARGQGGYGIPLTTQLAGSDTFYPDFLWWVDDGCWAIDTTGVHILGPKVRGKLLTIDRPRIALVTRGRVAASFDSVEDEAGWTLVLPGTTGARRQHYGDLGTLLAALRQVA